MKCPFLIKKTHGEKWKQISDVDESSSGELMFVEETIPKECIQTECAAWYNGRCHYYEHI